MIIEMMEAFDGECHGITFALDDHAYYETQDGLSWGANPTYRHQWNQSRQSEIRLQISRRETPTLEAPVLAQSKARE
jgi:hypothetical protein